jgi:hypothetical protein
VAKANQLGCTPKACATSSNVKLPWEAKCPNCGKLYVKFRKLKGYRYWCSKETCVGTKGELTFTRAKRPKA